MKGMPAASMLAPSGKAAAGRGIESVAPEPKSVRPSAMGVSEKNGVRSIGLTLRSCSLST